MLDEILARGALALRYDVIPGISSIHALTARHRVPLNRIGDENGQIFYGHSFICDERGDMLAEFGKDETGVLVAEIDLALVKRHRAAFGFFRDRRPDLYGRLVEDL